MTATALVRSAIAADLDEIWPLASALATSYVVTPTAFRSVFERLVDAPGVLLLVAESDRRVVGYLLAQKHHTFHANGPVLWVEELMVAPQHRGAGIGRALMTAAELWGNESGAAYVCLATRRAAGFYSALGYEPSASYFKRSLPGR